MNFKAQLNNFPDTLHQLIKGACLCVTARQIGHTHDEETI